MSPVRREAKAEPRRRASTVTVVEWATAASIGAGAVTLLALHLVHAGALWRDEASTVYLATLPSWRDVWASLPYDHCPPLVHVLIRGWWALGWGVGDFGLRVLGFCVGLLLLAAVWWAGRAMRGGVPLVPLALVCLNATVLTTVDSFRGYGIGCVTGIVMLALVWRFVKHPTGLNAVAAAAGAVLCVQGLYQNALFVLAGCCGAAAACAMTRRWRDAVAVVGIGATAAASLLPHLPILRRSQDWYVLEKSGFDLSWGWQKLALVIGSPHPAYVWIWAGLLVTALVLAVRAVASVPWKGAGPDERALAVFSGVALGTAVLGFAAFLEIADLPTQPWYYVPLAAFVAVCFDASIPACHRWSRPALAAFGMATLVMTWSSSVRIAETRQTNIDTIAARLEANASPSDYIIVHPWYFGATFARYFRGATPWTTIPPLADHALHRYDLFKAEMQKERPIQPVLDRARSTLRAGHQVWIVGWVPLDGSPPIETRPAPLSPWGWLDEQYSIAWGTQAGAFLTANADHGVIAAEPASGGVNPMENLPLVYVTGWRSSGPGGSFSR